MKYNHDECVKADKNTEPEFKVGDLVRQTKGNYTKYEIIYQIKFLVKYSLYGVEDNVFGVDAISNSKDSFELWRPKKDEWVWCWNYSEYPKLRKLICKSSTIDGISTWYDVEVDPDYIGLGGLKTEQFKFCEPFIGTLPSKIK